MAIEKTNKTAKPVTRTVVFVQNHRSAPITIMQHMIINDQKLPSAPIVLNPGISNPVDAEIWNVQKKRPIIQHYLDAGILSDSSRQSKNIRVEEGGTVDLDAIVPDLLKPTNESVGEMGMTARQSHAVFDGTVKV